VRDAPTRVEDSGGLVVTMAYDALGRRLSEANLWTGFAYAYDAGGRRTRMTFSDGFYVTYDYLANGAMSAIRETGATSGVGVLASYSYACPEPVEGSKARGPQASGIFAAYLI
jgi:YD repeat-containing protein